MAYLEIKNIVKTFGKFIAVNNVSFNGNQGEFITLLGPSGCGKTTLLKSIAGFYDVDGGEIILDGKKINDQAPEHRDTAMCFQSYALFPHMTVEKNVAFGLEQKKLPKDDIIRKVKEIISQVSLESQEKKQPYQLSGGQQQRVALARAMVMRPRLILFDEPLSNLDAKLREKVRFEIKQLQAKMNFTAIYVTHDQSEALALSDKIIVLNKGTIQQIGTPKEIYNHPNNSFVADFIGTANIMKGKVASNKGKTYEVETPLGTMKVVSEKPPAGEKIYLGWRPEHIEYHGAITKENRVKVQIVQSAFLGNCYHVLSSTDSDTTLSIRLEVSQKFDKKNGDTFEFCVQADRLFFLEEYDE